MLEILTEKVKAINDVLHLWKHYYQTNP